MKKDCKETQFGSFLLHYIARSFSVALTFYPDAVYRVSESRVRGKLIQFITNYDHRSKHSCVMNSNATSAVLRLRKDVMTMTMMMLMMIMMMTITMTMMIKKQFEISHTAI